MQASDDVEAIEVRLFLEALQAKYGYDLREYATTSITRRVRATLAKSGLHNLGELQHRVLHEPEFFAWVLDHLTVQVSEMFRDPGFYRSFRTQVVPILRTYPLLKIWHAGCASGEEAYASAILLDEEGLYDRAQIYATDLSPKALEQARQGVYSIAQVEKFAENYRQSGGTQDFSRYYTAAYDHVAMKESLRRNMLFFQHNLACDHVFGEMHAIFCRNVFIYFSPALKARVLGNFVQSLCGGGFLCLGSSERLSLQDAKSFTELCADERIYRKAAWCD